MLLLLKWLAVCVGIFDFFTDKSFWSDPSVCQQDFMLHKSDVVIVMYKETILIEQRKLLGKSKMIVVDNIKRTEMITYSACY